MSTSLLRKIFFILFSLPLFATPFVFAGASDDSGALFYSSVCLYISGIIIIVLGFKKIKILWHISLITISLSFLYGLCSYSGSLGGSLVNNAPFYYYILQFALILLFVIFLLYCFGIYKLPLDTKKEIILVLTLFFLPISVLFIAFMDISAVSYSVPANNFKHAITTNYSSIDECAKSYLYEKIVCYGYLAHTNGTANWCREYKVEHDPYFSINCMIGLSIYENNISICDNLTNESSILPESKSQCFLYFNFAKDKPYDCQLIKDKYLKTECSVFYPKWYIKNYAKMMGYLN